MVYNFSDKKSALLANKSASGGVVKNENMSNQKLADELHKPVITKFENRKVLEIRNSIDNIWGGDLANMQLISKFNKGIQFLLWYIFDIFSKYGTKYK